MRKIFLILLIYLLIYCCMNCDYNPAVETHTLTITAVNGDVMKDPNQTNYEHGTQVVLTAIPSIGYTFTDWSGDTSCIINPLAIRMNSNKNITANFATSTYTLTLTALYGTVTKNPNQESYTHGTTVTLTATPWIGYLFEGWSGDTSGTANPLTITMESNKNITAIFTYIDPCSEISTVTYSGNNYNTVAIGRQCWLNRNLDIGTMIQGNTDQTNNEIIEKYCYDNDSKKCSVYGGLYQWDEAMQYTTVEGAQGICPSGWHIPTKAEYQTLIKNVNNNSNALKRVGQGTGDGAGTNTSGFSALMAGIRSISGGSFLGLYYFTNIWNSTEFSTDEANYINMRSFNALFFFLHFSKDYGFSVRCIKD